MTKQALVDVILKSVRPALTEKFPSFRCNNEKKRVKSRVNTRSMVYNGHHEISLVVAGL